MILSFSRFYGTHLTDDDLLSFSEGLEGVCPGLGCWFLYHDEEFQRDMLAGAKLFWEAKKMEARTDQHGNDANDPPSITSRFPGPGLG